MTSEEMERAIEILLNNQARYELQLEQTNQQVKQTSEQVAETNRQLAETNRQLADTNRQVEVITRQVGEINRQVGSLAGTIGSLNDTVGSLARSQNELMEVVLQYIRSQDKINKTVQGSIRDLSNIVERYISEGRNGKS